LIRENAIITITGHRSRDGRIIRHQALRSMLVEKNGLSMKIWDMARRDKRERQSGRRACEKVRN
jgi:hypothetical protein